MTYSWGEFYETTKNCDGYSDEEKKQFAVFEALDKATTLEEIKEIIEPLTEYEINRLNSPCLDGIIFTMKDLGQKLYEKEYVETYKYYMDKNLVHLSVNFIAAIGFMETLKAILDRDPSINLDTILSYVQNSPDNFTDMVFEACNLRITYNTTVVSRKDIIDFLVECGAKDE